MNAPVDRRIIEADLREVADRVNRRSGSPHPDQLLDVFLMKMLVVLGRKAEAAKYAESVLRDFSTQDGWYGRAETTTHAVSVLAALEKPPANMRAIVTTASRIVRTNCVRHGPGLASWGDRVATTSYTITNLLESPLRDRPDLRDLVADGVRWLASQQQADGRWLPETPPFGGEGEIVHPAYFTAVALRGLIAHVHDTRGGVAMVQASYARARIEHLESELNGVRAASAHHLASRRRWRIGATALTASVGIGGAAFAVYQFKALFVANRGEVTGIAILAIGAIIVLIFDLVDYFKRIAKWLRAKLR